MSQQTTESEQSSYSPAEIARTYADITQRTSRILAQFIEKKSKKGICIPHDELGLAQAFMDMSARLLSNPYKLAKSQAGLMWDYFALWQHSTLKLLGVPNAPVATPQKGDRRFHGEDWEERLLFDFIKQSYLITARRLHDTVSDVEGLDEATRQKVSFFTRQYIDAVSPSNFAFTNPEVLRETVRSNGQNLLKGFDNLLQDIETGGGELRIRMTDLSAFELGGNVATTPGKVVFQNTMFQLIQYEPATPKQYRKPLLIIPPWINKFYILDLREKNSFVRWATAQGHSVYVVSWVNPDETLARKNFEDYMLEGALIAIDKVLEDTGEQQLNVIGYCIGGTLTMSTLAYMTEKKDDRVASATFFTTLLDFSDPGEIGIFLDDNSIREIEERMDARGYLEGSEMANTFNMLRSNDLIWSFVVNNYLMGKQPFPFDLLFWNSDSTRLPAAMHSFYLRNMYLENRLKDPGGITLAGVPIDIRKVKTPCYFISTIEDHIAPWKGTYLGARLPGGPVRFVVGGSGHIAGIVNPPANNKYGYWINDAKVLPATPEEYLIGATQYAGSWWTNWHEWVIAHDDTQVEARRPGTRALKVIEDAPGSYVKQRLGQKQSVDAAC
ncbi:MAG: class I poly(R)-hydroxyalkanoic acid synthase [Zoogloeaceae bacterium]|jgi:polyhydroxyalkanoate synthase|nr:class I poly(R)-hydroxyalkanoic acid synthase [Zoogloeaceae bacterium]